jgi:hypothetical protein
MKSHFFDIDTLIKTESKVWLVDKMYPNVPIIKITKSDFNLIKKGIFRNNGFKIKFSGEEYFLPEYLMNDIKIKCKNSKTNISNLSFSMQEFFNKELIENLDHKINLDNIIHLKNTTDDIYIICSKNNKNNYEYFIEKLESKLEENGLKIKKYYFISETFYNRDEDEISHKKIRLLIQHIVGFKTDINKFTNQELTEYDEINFYEDEVNTVEMAKKSTETLQFILSNTEKEIMEQIKDKLKKTEKILYVNLITPNKLNRFVKTTTYIKLPNLFKTFESFSWSRFKY